MLGLELVLTLEFKVNNLTKTSLRFWIFIVGKLELWFKLWFGLC